MLRFISVFQFLPYFLFSQAPGLRPLADTVGFAHTRWQMDSIVKRTDALFPERTDKLLKENGIKPSNLWKAVICPHDDYAYAGYMYPLALKNVCAKTVILFGVAHKAKQLKLQDKIIFDSYPEWKGCYGNIRVSPLREKIISKLPKDQYEVNDSMQTIEHSVEGILPWLQYFNREVNIISVLVPYSSFDHMDKMALPLASAIYSVMKENKLEWGKDIAFVISSDAVHYGDEDWAGRNFAFMGSDTAGYQKAVARESEIIAACLTSGLSKEKIRKFTEYTVKPDDYKEYLWTWCGRYSVPMGLLTAFHLSNIFHTSLTMVPLDYATSISMPHVKVSDLNMGVTAPAKLRHWVGYFSGGIK